MRIHHSVQSCTSGNLTCPLFSCLRFFLELWPFWSNMCELVALSLWYMGLSLKCGSAIQSCLTHFNPTDYSPPASSVHGVFQARILEWVTVSFSRRSSRPRDQICISCLSYIGRQFLYHCATWKSLLLPLIINSFFFLLCWMICFMDNMSSSLLSSCSISWTGRAVWDVNIFWELAHIKMSLCDIYISFFLIKNSKSKFPFGVFKITVPLSSSFNALLKI